MGSKRFLGPLVALILVLAIAPASGQDAAPEGANSDLQVVDMAFGTGYDYATRTLTGVAATFPAGTEVVWCRTRVNGAEEPTTVTHVWYRDGKTMARVELSVASSSYRTVSSKKLLPEWAGQWEVKVLDEAGTVLRAESFTIE